MSGRVVGLGTVAEGIETGEQLALVCELGCDIGQGYYFSRPCPADELYTLLTREAAFATLFPSAGD